MLCAYYDKSCDSRVLFQNLEISELKSFEKGLNRYNVIYLDITRFIARAKNKGSDMILDLQAAVIEELIEAFPACIKEGETFLADALFAVSEKTDEKFIIIIDEWDALFREAKNDEIIQKQYIQLLRGLFKAGPITDRTIAAAYMTGILPIKKYGTESALTDFKEFTMTKPAKLARYIGFTEEEVRKLCTDQDMDFEKMSAWYDGYSFHNIRHVYNPNSVMNAILDGEIANYWTSSETYESLKSYISMNFDGLKDSIVAMLGGEQIRVKVSMFQNDVSSFKSKDDVLTLLIHLGYLGYDAESGKAFIPNQEIADAFADAVSGDEWADVGELLQDSENLLEATLRGDSDAMVIELKYNKGADTAIKQIHENRYEGDLKKYFDNLLLVGINYDKDAVGENAKKHTCVIEKV